MKLAEQKTQNKIRRQAAEALLVYDLNTKLPVGQILDLSAIGMKLMTEDPMDMNRMYYCRIPLDKPVKGKTEIFLDAECRWCVPDPKSGWYHSGYLLRFPSRKDAEVVQAITKAWIEDHMAKQYAKYGITRRKKKRFWSKLFGG